ncbi:hypothetical protein Taro_038867 [Colocasia esculenta]|uniref:Mitochondrial substrate carrier family protein n=1 Tax=Colocasia esculenta TaxID=4460 RepID=A0A843WE20_COLES|nr:hypothetical protein [Colocasia esculenta]
MPPVINRPTNFRQAPLPSHIVEEKKGFWSRPLPLGSGSCALLTASPTPSSFFPNNKNVIAAAAERAGNGGFVAASDPQFFPFFFFFSSRLFSPVVVKLFWILACLGDSRGIRGTAGVRGFVGRSRSSKSDASSLYAFHQFSTSGAAVAVATGVTHPLDVVKVRLQMQLVGQKGPLNGMGNLFAQLVKIEGPKALYLGFAPALTRSVLYGGLRLGLYEPCKYVCDYMFGSTNILVKVASGAFSGAIATSLTNPVEVLKVRLQINSNSKRGPIKEVHKIVREEGIKALWKGVGPAMVRAGALTASQLATYDESKQVAFQFLFPFFHRNPDGITEVDTYSRRFSSASHVYNFLSYHVLHKIDGLEFKKVYFPEVTRTEGFRALYKGGSATFARLGPQTVITFLVCEKLRELAGMKAI